MALHERLQQANTLLSPSAIPHEGRLGRRVSEPEDDTRFPFQRDRDRIIHAQAFRRLQGKTQVFVAGEGDHFRTRLTHTMEVAQIARDIARTLQLNEDLTECIALAHDLGHPPFGHAGEAALDEYMKSHDARFEHNQQSIRIVTLLEEHSSLLPGLNLNQEVLEGLMKHEQLPNGPTLEARVADLSDEIAYTGHDSDDGLRANLFTLAEITDVPLARRAAERAAERGTSLRGALIHLLVTDLYDHNAIRRAADSGKNAALNFSGPMRADLAELRAFLQTRMYAHPSVVEKNQEGQHIILGLTQKFEREPSQKILELRGQTGSELFVAVKDYVAGMTDAFAGKQLTSDL